jgi:CubicO group peptidase (beta-lactamase class C family)
MTTLRRMIGDAHARPSFLRIATLLMAVVLASCATAQPPVNRVEAMEQLMTRYEENGLFSGAVLVAEGGEIIYEGAFGYANREWDVPNTVDTRFRIASISKPFTMILAFQLYEEGVLDLKGTIKDYLPDYEGPGAERITVEQLLVHSSGLASESAVRDLDDIERHTWTKDKFLSHIAGYELQFEPGERRAYSNFGYFVLALILEAASGQSYAELLDERICGRLGMTYTMVELNKPIIERRASGYHYDPELGVVNAPYLDMSFVYGAGHLLSTVRDLFTWDTALKNGELLSEELTEFMLSFDGQRERLGSSRHEEDVFRHGGSINGFLCSTHSYTQDDRFVVVLSNVKDRSENYLPSTFTVARNLAAILYGVRYDLPDPVE